MPKKKASAVPDPYWWPEAQWKWSSIVSSVLTVFNMEAKLSELYSIIESHPHARINKHWKAKVRQTLQASDHFVRVGEGRWGLASWYDAQKVKRLNAKRRKLYPKRSSSER